ncbi:MAG: hypothetical protein ACXQS2_06950 [Methermicoccaceae archaeon]
MKIRLEVQIDGGQTVSITFDGVVPTPNLQEEVKLQICSFVDAVVNDFSYASLEPPTSGIEVPNVPMSEASSPTFSSHRSGAPIHSHDEPTLKERLEMFLKYGFEGEWFTSREVRDAYEKSYSSRISLSTVSTYLSRMHEEGVLERGGSRKERKYRVMSVKFSEEKISSES